LTLTGNREPDVPGLRKLLDAATGRPWSWRGNVDARDIRLGGYAEPTSEDGKRRRWGTTVLRFARWGMSSARPRFNVDDLMRDGEEFAVFEVAPNATSRKDPQVYRGDIVDLRHPDAQLIVAAVNNLDALLNAADERDRLRVELEQARAEAEAANGQSGWLSKELAEQRRVVSFLDELRRTQEERVAVLGGERDIAAALEGENAELRRALARTEP
jgi:hypothetical protein